MNINDIVKTLQKYDSDEEIKEVIRCIKSINYRAKNNRELFLNIVEKYKENLNVLQKDKVIDLNKKYYVSQWSYNPMMDGEYIYEEIIREHSIINGIDCYFTNKNYRVYFKEDIYENEEDAKEFNRWKNSFGYEYDSTVSRHSDVRQLIKFETVNNSVIWSFNN